MKSLKTLSVAALFTVSAFGVTLFSSCGDDPCKDTICQNGGTCNENSGACNCPVGFEGASCQTKSFYGSWKGSDDCTSGDYTNITVKVDPSSTDSSRVLVSNIGGFGASVVVSGALSSDGRTITITGADVGGSRTLSGTMTLTSSTTFTSEYSVTPATGTADNCDGTYTKQ